MTTTRRLLCLLCLAAWATATGACVDADSGGSKAADQGAGDGEGRDAGAAQDANDANDANEDANDANDAADQQDPDRTLPPIAPGADATVRVGEEDQVLSLDDGLELAVPASAVDVPLEIAVRVVDANPTGFALGSAVYRFEPAGLRFTAPVTLRIPLADTAPQDATLYWTHPAGGFEALESRIEDGFMLAEVRHFSVGFVGKLSDATGSAECAGAGQCSGITDAVVDAVDLLFMVDNSGSMREEQAALAAQFPRMIEVLTSGDLGLDGTIDFPPVQDLHLGVVSSDMGLVGISGIPGCEGLGDDGIMNDLPSPTLASCQASYPHFLSYTGGANGAATTARDFACIATLGTDGCGFEQQLESGLKALWPSVDVDPETGTINDPNRIRFLGDVNGFGQLGHGDQENAGFLRSASSMLGIVMVTDEEDCSSADTRHFTPSIYLDPSDPLAMQDLNLRCFMNPQNLYALDRYENGFKALRPGQEELVVFAAIAGVPPDLVDASARAGVNFSDQAQRDAYYDGILDDPRMEEQLDPSRTPEQGGNLLPSCTTATGRAFPPRRFVELARRFGGNGVVQSICQEDFTPAIDGIVDRIAARITGACYPRALMRDDVGEVACDVVWALPEDPKSGTPGSCSDAAFLAPRGDAADRFCSVAQLAVPDSSEPAGTGWYYDDFSDRLETCPEGNRQGVAFTQGARPPSDVSVFLDCL